MKTYKTKLPEICIKYKSGEFYKVKIRSSKDSFNVFKKLFDPDVIEWQESVIALFLNKANNTIGYYRVSIGGVSGTVIDPKIVFSPAILSGASAIILCHNHPSGDLNPSRADIKLTKKFNKGSKLLGLTLLDHIMISKDNYYSFADERIIS